MSIAPVVVYNIHSELSYLYANMSIYLTFSNIYVYTVPIKGKKKLLVEVLLTFKMLLSEKLKTALQLIF